MTFSEKVKISRQAADMTQSQLAEAIGVSRRAVVAYENDDAVARNNMLKKIARVLHVSYDYLLYEDVTNPKQGILKVPYIDDIEARFGKNAAKEVDELLNNGGSALFAGGELSDRAKEVFFDALVSAYITCKEESRQLRKRKSYKNADK